MLAPEARVSFIPVPIKFKKVHLVLQEFARGNKWVFFFEDLNGDNEGLKVHGCTAYCIYISQLFNVLSSV